MSVDSTSDENQPENFSVTSAGRLAIWLDSSFTIPGTSIKFGIDPILGLIPGIGDWMGGIISTYFLLVAVLQNSRPAILIRMVLNVLIDIIIGAIPILGELFDIGFKANTKNAKLLERAADEPEKTEQASRFILWSVFIVSLIIIFGILAGVIWLFAQVIAWLF